MRCRSDRNTSCNRLRDLKDPARRLRQNTSKIASSLAIAISNDLDSEQSGLLAAFLTAVADNLAIIAIQKAKEESNNSS